MSVAILAAAVSGCGEERSRVLLVGIDGASVRVMRPLLREGDLPSLSRIAERGVFGPLRSFPPLFSPRIWTTVATGKTPEKHGIGGFFRLDDEERAHLLLSSDRRAHALWNIASDAGLRSGVVNWWTTFPPEKIDGIMVSDHALPDALRRRRELLGAIPAPSGPTVSPPGRQEWVDAIMSRDEPPVPFPDPFAANDALADHVDTGDLSQFFRNDAAFARVAIAIDAELRPDLLMVLLPGIDRVSHWLWGNLEPAELYPERLRPSPAEREAGREALYDYYRYTDALIGRLLEGYGPDDLVLVVSDHGFEGGVVEDHALTGVHWGQAAAESVLFASGRGVRAQRALGAEATIRDVTPTILAWLGLPVARDMDGRPAPFLEPDPAAPERIASYDTTPIERVATGAPRAEDDILEDLRALGYLE